MSPDVKKIYDYVTKMEDFYYNNVDNEKVGINILMSAQAMSFQKVRYFIEDMEENNESGT